MTRGETVKEYLILAVGFMTAAFLFTLLVGPILADAIDGEIKLTDSVSALYK